MEAGLGYVPSRWALSLHRLPRYNIRLGLADSLFAPDDWEYQQTFLLLAAVIALGLCLNLLFLLIDVARHCRRAQGAEEPRPGELCCPTWGCVAAVVICCMGIGIGFHGNGEINDGMVQITHSLATVNHTLAAMETMVQKSTDILGKAVREDLTELEELFSERPEFLLPTRDARRQAEALVSHLRRLVYWRGLGPRLLEVSEWGERVERARWPMYLVLLLSDALLCLASLFALASLSRCLLLCLTVLAVLSLCLSWLCLGVELAAALALSDFCVEPDLYVLNTSQWRGVLSSDILEYYVRCDEATPNPFQQSLALSQRATSEILHQLQSLLRGSASQLSAAQPRILSVLRTLNSSEGTVHALVAGLHCHWPHQHLLDLWMGLCYDGLEGTLTLSLFSLLSALSFSFLASCLSRVWGWARGTREPLAEEMDEEEEGQDVFRPPDCEQLPRYLSRPRLHTFSSYSRPCLRTQAWPRSASASHYM